MENQKLNIKNQNLKPKTKGQKIKNSNNHPNNHHLSIYNLKTNFDRKIKYRFVYLWLPEEFRHLVKFVHSSLWYSND